MLESFSFMLESFSFEKKKNDIEFHENLTHDLVAAMTSQGERYVVFT